jgi:histone deacetylase 1/2
MIIVVMNGWKLRQMDIHNVFLNGDISEIVYMVQPPGFNDLSTPNHDRKL